MEPKTNLEAKEQFDPVLLRAINDDPEALEELFSRHRDRLYRTAFRLTGNADDAEGAFQDGMCSAYVNLSKFESRSRFSTWVTSIVINAALLQRRRHRSITMIPIDEAFDPKNQLLVERMTDRAPNPEEECGREEQLQFLKRMLQSLPPLYRNALWLCDLQGVRYSEPAEILGIPIGSLKAQLHRARKLLNKVSRALPRLRHFQAR